MYTHITLVLLF